MVAYKLFEAMVNRNQSGNLLLQSHCNCKGTMITSLGRPVKKRKSLKIVCLIANPICIIVGMAKKKPEQKSRKSPLGFIAFAALLLAVAVFALTRGNGDQPAAMKSDDVAVSAQDSHSETKSAGDTSDSTTPENFRMPPYFEDPRSAGILQPTLDPASVQPFARAGYKIAKEKPNLLTQLPCFCYCDRFGHSSLYTCFETVHAEQCEICLKEAVEADQMDRQGMSPQEIRTNIVERHHPRDNHSHS